MSKLPQLSIIGVYKIHKLKTQDNHASLCSHTVIECRIYVTGLVRK